MDARRLVVPAFTVAVISVAGFTLTQAQNTPPAPAAAPPRPVETILQTSPEDRRAAVAARGSAFAERARSILAKLPRDRFDPAALEKAPVPVLVPGRPGFLQNLRLSVGEHDYTASGRENGRLIQVFGTRRAFQPPKGAVLPRPQPDAQTRSAIAANLPRVRTLSPADPNAPPNSILNVRVERTESGVDVAFGRFGAAYSVSIECPNPETDEACADGPVLDLVRNMQVIGGGGQ